MLREHGLQVAPSSYPAWKPNPPSTRTVDAAQVVDKLRTGGVNGRPLPEVLCGRRKMTAWPPEIGRSATCGRSVRISACPWH